MDRSKSQVLLFLKREGVTQGGSGTASRRTEMPDLGKEPPLLGSQELDQKAQGESGVDTELMGVEVGWQPPGSCISA